MKSPVKIIAIVFAVIVVCCGIFIAVIFSSDDETSTNTDETTITFSGRKYRYTVSFIHQLEPVARVYPCQHRLSALLYVPQGRGSGAGSVRGSKDRQLRPAGPRVALR